MHTMTISSAEIISNLSREFIRDVLQANFEAELTELKNTGSGAWTYEREHRAGQVIKGVAAVTIIDGVAQIEATEQQPEQLTC